MNALRLDATFASRLATFLKQERHAGHIDLRMAYEQDGLETLVCTSTRLTGSVRVKRIGERRR